VPHIIFFGVQNGVMGWNGERDFQSAALYTYKINKVTEETSY